MSNTWFNGEIAADHQAAVSSKRFAELGYLNEQGVRPSNRHRSERAEGVAENPPENGLA
jgi:hypothetical protein